MFRQFILKIIAWLITLLLKWGKEKIEHFIDGDNAAPSLDQATELAYEPLAQKLIEMDAHGDLAAVDAVLRKLRDKALGRSDSDGQGE